ncbi:hypothetical protein NDA15_006783 [Ustilago hordei]|nr:hypothetical protein NDA15_006783 [Ustilago hordei]
MTPRSGVSVDDDEVDGVGDEIGDVDDNEVDGVGDKVGGVNTSVQCVDLTLEVIPRTAVDYCLRFYLYPDR